MFKTIARLFGTKKPQRMNTRRLSLVGLEERCMLSTVPAAPSFFTATGVSTSQVALSWHTSTGATSYRVDEWTNTGWVYIGSVNGNSTGATVNGLSAGTTYAFEVGASNAAGTSWTNYTYATTIKAIVEPLAANGYSPVGGSLFGPNGPSPLDVSQGDVGDCWLISSLAEVAARDPSDIRNMFAYDGTTVENGSVVGLYTVRFFDNGVARYVTVDTELPTANTSYEGYYDHPLNNVLWVALAEKAYVEANAAGYVTTNYEYSDSYNALNGGQPSWALTAITGKSANGYSINPSNIAAAWNAGELIVLTTTSPQSQYIVSGHCYAVVGYNPSSSQPFEILNPWGGTTGSPWCPQAVAIAKIDVYGLFTANAAGVAQNFAGQTFGIGASVGVANHGNLSLEVAIPTESNSLIGPFTEVSTGTTCSAASSHQTVDPSPIDVTFPERSIQHLRNIEQDSSLSVGQFMNSIYIGDTDAFGDPVI